MKLSKLKSLLLAAICAGTAIAVGAAESGGPGIAVGAKAPAFSLPDQAGKTQSLTGLLNQQKKVALVFYRSADW